MELKAREAHIPEGWREVTVEDLKAPTDNALSTGPFGSSIGSRFFEPHGVPVIRGSNLATDGSTRFIDNGFVFVTEAKAREFRRSVVTSGDLVFTCWGTINQVGLIGPRTAYPRYVISNKQMKFTPDEKKADGLFLFYLFSGPELQRAILDQGIGSSVPGFNLGQLRALRLKVPPLSEQRAIAEALGDVDALLGALIQLITKKRDLKQAAMQQLLTGQTRLPGFSGEWEVKRLGEISEVAMGRTPRRLNPACWGRGYKWLSIADLQSKVVSESNEEITELAASEMTIISKGTLLMSFKLSIGRLCFAGCDLFTNEAICCFNKLKADPEYLYYALGRTDFSLYGKQAVKGYTLNKESLKIVEVHLPPLPEQTAIAAVLSDMDAELVTLEQRLAKTRALKQGMMQELLTGRTRLV